MTSGAFTQFRLAARALVLVAIFLPMAAFSQGTVYYRYVNDQGVQVLDDDIPPRYAQKGYEVVSLTGEVIKKVEPAPDSEALARREAEAQVRENYQRLKRRYSSLADIQSARDRKLENIETNIVIVRGNIAGLENQIRSLMSEAADVERQGREVPDRLVKKLNDTRAELAVAEERLAARLQEREKTAKRFAEDLEIYAKGRELTERRSTQ